MSNCFTFCTTYFRRIQEEREERHKYKGALRGALSESVKSDDSSNSKDENVDPIDYGDPSTTNLYLGNLNPKVRFSINFIINCQFLMKLINIFSYTL